MKALHDRYKKSHPRLTYYITENGIADDTDIIRQPYLIEHLIALRKVMDAGVPVEGYIFWTISDNWEWADGYCPKFGLVLVDRKKNLARYKRPSFYLFKEIAEKKKITQDMREYAQNLTWKAERLKFYDPVLASNWDGSRPFCRKIDGLESHDEPIRIPLIFKNEWWFKEHIRME